MKRKFTFNLLLVAIYSAICFFGTAQSTTFTYSNPGVLQTGQAISTVSPTISNGTISGGTLNNTTVFAGTGTSGSTNDNNPLLATFQNPDGMVKDALGNYYVAELGGKRIRKISSSGVVSTIAQLSSYQPRDIAINTSNGDLYFITNVRLCRIVNSNAANYPTQAPIYNFTNESSTVVAGNGNSSNGDNTIGTSASFGDLSSLAISPDNSFIVLTDGNPTGSCPPQPARIRKVLITTNFPVSTIQMCGWKNWEGISNPTGTQWACGWGIFLNTLYSKENYGSNFYPKDVMFVSNTLMYVLLERRDFMGDDWNGFDRIVSLSFETTTDIKYVPPGGNNPTVTTYQTYPYKWGNVIAGSSGGMTNDNYDGSNTTANFDIVNALTKDEAGNLYLLENEKVRKITPNGHVSTIAGSIWLSSGDAVGDGINARLNAADIYYDQAGGFLLISDYANHKIKKIQLEGFEILPSPPTGLTFNTANGQLTGTPTENTLSNHYINSFNASQYSSPTTATVLGTATLSGDASLVGDYVLLTPRANSKFGGFTIPASGSNSNALRVSFNYISTKVPADNPADGFSYSFAPNASATATSPVAEVGTGTKLMVSFATFGSNRGIRIYYNGSTSQGLTTTTNPNGPLLAYSNNTSWMGKSAAIDIKIALDGKLSLYVDGTAVITDIQLPSDYSTSDKSTWIHVFKARTGAENDLMGIDNLAILHGPGVTNHQVIARDPAYLGTQTLPIYVTALPTLIASGITAETHNSATTSYAITSIGSTAISSAGIVWGTSSNPTITSNLGTASASATNSGNYTNNITSLNGSTTYYVRAYATTAAGQTVYSNELNFTTLVTPPNISYTPSSNVYTVGTAIAPLSVVNTGGAIPVGVESQVSNFASSATGNIRNMCFDSSGDMYYADATTLKVYKATTAGTITVVAGSGTSAYTNGTGTSAAFVSPWGITIDASNNLYVADFGGIRKITPDGVVTSYVTLANAQFGGLSFDGSGNLFAVVRQHASYTTGNRVVKITPAGVLTTFAGSTTGDSGNTDATGTAARFNNPSGLTIDDNDNLYVADYGNYRVRKITPAGVVTTYAGSTQGNIDGTGTAAKFTMVYDLSADSYDNIYVTDYNRVRKITSSGVVTTYAGPGTSGTNTNGNASLATFTSSILGSGVNASNQVFISQSSTSNAPIRKITQPIVGSYTVNPTLPAGLTLSSTGAISGTPTIFSAAQDYVVTGTNASASATTTINIEVQAAVNHTLNLTASQADEITETSATIVGDFMGGTNSSVVSPAPYSLTPYGDNANIGHIYQMTITGDATGGTVWGSGNLYTHDSHIARAVVHAGILAHGVTGTVYLKLSGPQNSYPASTANGVTTSYWGYWYYSYEFVSGIPTTPTTNTMTQKGILYTPTSTSAAPTLATVGMDTVNANNTLIDDFSLSLTGLTPGTNYTARAYATNAGGTYYSTPVTFSTPNITYSNYTKTLGDVPFYVSNQYSPSTSTVVYSSSNTSIATVSGNTITIVGAGTATITASQASQGTSGYYGLIENTFTVTVAKGTPTLSMSFPSTTPLNTFTNGSTLNITVSSNSNGTLGLSSSVGTIGGSNGAFNLGDVSQTGSITLTATVAESDNYLAATLSQTLNVEKANQTITFPTPSAITYSPGGTLDTSFFDASSTSGLPITYTLGTNFWSTYGASLSGSTLSINNSSVVTIIATQAGDNNYNPAVSVSQQLIINKATPTLAIDNLSVQYSYSVPNAEHGYLAMPLDAASAPQAYTGPEYTTNSNGAISFEVLDPATNTVSYFNGNNLWMILEAGTFDLVMNQAPGTNYTAGTATSTLTVTKADQTVEAPLMIDISVIDFVNNGITLFDTWDYYGDGINGGMQVYPIPHPYINASYGPGQLKPEFIVESQNPGGAPSATLSESMWGSYLQYNPNGDGTVKLTITQSGDQNHNAVTTPVVRTFNVVKSNQTLTVDDVNDAPVSSIGQSFVFNPSTNANYGLNWGLTYPLVVTSSDANVISWNAITNELTYVGAGTATITVTQAGNAYYNAASHTQTVTVSNSIPLATVTNTTQNFCSGATLQSLEAQTNVISANLLWYAQATGGSALDYTTTLTNNTTYYVAQELNGSESSRTAVAVVFYQDLSGVTVSTISGSSTAVAGTPLVLSVSPINGATSYIWDLPAGLTIASSSNNGATVTITVSSGYATGIVKVKALNSCGETAWQTKTVNAPGQTGISITTTQSGAPVICGGASNVPFSVTAATGATYAWTLPTGLSFAAGYDGDEQTTYVNFAAGYVGGAITCVRTTATATNTASYNVGGLATPGSISGTSVLCNVTSATYSVGSVPNATSYEWQLPTGMSGTSTTNSITATWTSIVSGTIKVRAIGTCGTSAWRTLSVGAVATPSAISGPTMICGAATYTITGSTMTQVSQTTLNYSVTNVAGLTYNWSVPAGMSLSSGQGTNAIVVEVDPTTFTTGQVTVTATATSTSNNTCVSSARTLTVSKAVASITGPTAICGLTTATYSVPSGSGTSFTWTLPSWMTPATGYTLTSNPIQVDIAATGTSTQSISVEIETSCGDVTVSRSVGCGLYTQLSSASCGAAVSSLSAGISANNIVGAQGYKFQIAIPSQSATTYYYIESSDRWFALSEAMSMPQLYGTTYSIRVSLVLGNSWGDYGAACTVSTPSLPTTTLSNSSCGATLSSLSAGISANNVQGATMYRFEITPDGSQTTYTVDSPDRWFALTEATGMPLLYGTTYSITVTLENGTGVWGTAGAACTVTTPTLPTTMLSNASCGATLSSLSAGISANNVQGTTTYRFTITPNIQNATSYTVDSPDRWFALTEATGMSLLYGTTYSVTVTLENGTGIWGTAGTACTVTTPTLPTTTLSIASCGATLTSFSTVISANNVQGATMYEFHITDGATLLEYTVQSPDRWITLSEGQSVGQTPQALVPTWDNVYTIKVKVQSGSVWSAYGTECFVNTASQGLAQQDPQLHEEQTEGLGIEESSNVNGLEENQLQNTTWTATATSNPFAHSFQIKLNGAEAISTDASFTAQLTDMSGKVYSQATLSKEQLEAESFGEQLAPGMYLMTLRQGEELRVIRVVKR